MSKQVQCWPLLTPQAICLVSIKRTMCDFPSSKRAAHHARACGPFLRMVSGGPETRGLGGLGAFIKGRDGASGLAQPQMVSRITLGWWVALRGIIHLEANSIHLFSISLSGN